MQSHPVATASNYYHQHFYTPPTLQSQYHDSELSPLGVYRPLQLPLQHQPSADQLLAAHAGFHSLNFRPLHHHPQQHPGIPPRARQQNRRQQQAAMAYQQSDDELAELQKLSEGFEPEVTGPLVGQREPSTNITTEYASADPVFQAKTAALPQKYSHYRTIRGDGRCGWRAIAYGYFETLIHLGDSNKFLEEEARLRSLSNVLNQAGYDALLYEDFADAMFDTLRKVHNALQTGDAETILHEDFNDEALQNYIITYLKTLTSAWMKTKQSEYSPWLLGQTVSQYCDMSVMPIGAEIDNVSLSALKDVFLSKAGIALEVLYLDRTEGEEVNMHRFDPVNYHGGVTIGTIRLLYRPGHYDILYKAEDFPQPVPPMQTYLQYGSHMHDDPVGEVGCPDFMALIPGMSYANPHQAWMSNSSYGSDFFATPAPVNQCVPPPIPTPAPAPQTQPQVQPQPVYVSPPPTQIVPPPTQMPHEMAIRSAPSHGNLNHAGFQDQLSGPFRPSAWELKDGFVQATSQMPLQTSIFRNSHFNTAHFLNPDFQPEEWRPEEEYVTTTKSSRHRTCA
ncbi:cysteine proteinase [Hortaea werneckii]|nr:cysteine proteinase [Hortaea werneckii]